MADVPRPRVGLAWSVFARSDYGYVTRQKSVPASLLAPLLDHWGLRLLAPARPMAIERVGDRGSTRLLALETPGRWQATGGACRVGTFDFLAGCAIGSGRSLLVADADLMQDALWAAATPRGTERHQRLSDNPLILAGWLDRLAGMDRQRAARPVAWQRPDANRGTALLLAILPILAALAAFAALRYRNR